MKNRMMKQRWSGRIQCLNRLFWDFKLSGVGMCITHFKQWLSICRRKLIGIKKFMQTKGIPFFVQNSTFSATIAYLNPSFQGTNIKTVEFAPADSQITIWQFFRIMNAHSYPLSPRHSGGQSDESTPKYSHIFGCSAMLRLTPSASRFLCSFNFLNRFSVSLSKPCHILLKCIHFAHPKKVSTDSALTYKRSDSFDKLII